MKILFINGLYENGSTGFLLKTLSDYNELKGGNSASIYGFLKKRSGNFFKTIKGQSKISLYFEFLRSRITGYNGFFCRKGETKKAIEFIKKFSPDLINIHNLHGNYIDAFLLLDFIKKEKIKTVVTMHDCWDFTGLCPHFQNFQCEKWKTKCSKCKFYKKIKYPRSWFFDRSKKQFELKQELFNNPNITFVAPCEWISSFAKQAPITRNNNIRVIYNGIDFYKIKSINFSEKSGKKILLGVSGSWGLTKGIYEFGKLSESISPEYKIILIGKYKTEFKRKFPKIEFLGPISDKRILKGIYEKSFAFINPTFADTFPTTNLEALQSGTPIILYDTGGNKELINKNAVFHCVSKNVSEIIEKINIINMIKPVKSDIVKYGMTFTSNNMCSEYYSLFKKILRM